MVNLLPTCKPGQIRLTISHCTYQKTAFDSVLAYPHSDVENSSFSISHKYKHELKLKWHSHRNLQSKSRGRAEDFLQRKMYVTRPLSMYQKHPDFLSLPPPEGPSSGILVIQDEEAEPTCCLGMCKTGEIKELPFPQNKSLELRYTIGIGYERTSHFHNVTFIPVLNQPLSSNCYYAVQPYGKYRGYAFYHKLQ